MKAYNATLPVVLISLLLFPINNPVYAQAPSIQWQNCIGGSGNEYGYCIKPTTGNGYIIAGTTTSMDIDAITNHGGNDAYIVKLSAAGDVLWQRLLGGTGEDYVKTAVQTFDGGYIAVGSSSSTDGDVTGNHGGHDLWLVKLSAFGVIQWQSAMGGSSDDYGYDVRQTFDSGYIVSGRSKSTDGNLTTNHGNYDYWVVKVSATGSIQWQQSFGGSSDDNAMSIRQTSDTGFIVAGDSYSADGNITASKGGEDYWIIKLSKAGNIEWEKSLGGSGADYAQSVRQTYDGGYIIAGGSNSIDGDITTSIGGGDYWVVKLSATGSIQWQKSFGSDAADAANALEITPDSGYVIAGWVSAGTGSVTGWHGQADYWVIKLSAGGGMLWQKCLGGIGNENAQSVVPTGVDECVVAGYTNFSGGDVATTHGGLDIWVAKLAVPNVTTDLHHNTSITVSPNPTKEKLTISGAGKVRICIYDRVGRLVAEANDTESISLDTLQPGLYFATIMNGNGEVLKQCKISKI